MTERLILDDLWVQYQDFPAVRGVSLSLRKGEILGIVGESGSGKSTLLRSITGLLDSSGQILQGKICLDQIELSKLSQKQMQQIRGRQIGMIFQNTSTSLCPVMTIRRHFYDAIGSHRKCNKKEDTDKILLLLEKLGLPDGNRILNSYPFELSGGMCQRISVALAMILQPDFLLADEPTSALDVTVQIQVVEEMRRLRELFGTGILIVSHNMDVITRMADTVGVMYAGRLLELGPKNEVLRHPLHPYTKGLLAAIPRIGGGMPQGISGSAASDLVEHEGCCFAGRCEKAAGNCFSGSVPKAGTDEHWALCHMLKEGHDVTATS